MRSFQKCRYFFILTLSRDLWVDDWKTAFVPLNANTSSVEQFCQLVTNYRCRHFKRTLNHSTGLPRTTPRGEWGLKKVPFCAHSRFCELKAEFLWKSIVFILEDPADGVCVCACECAATKNLWVGACWNIKTRAKQRPPRFTSSQFSCHWLPKIKNIQDCSLRNGFVCPPR